MKVFLITIIAAIAGIGLILMLWGLIEASLLNVARTKINAGTGSGADTAAPDLRILYFSDLHREFCLIPARRVIRIIRKESSVNGLDAVIFGGDICIGRGKVKRGIKYLNAVAAVCRELNIPFMAVTGNHDCGAPAEDLGLFEFDNMDGCIKYLKSRTGGRYIAFAGVRDHGRRNRKWAVPPKPSAGIEYKSYILLSHNPDLVLHMPADLPFKVDLMISGHIHGGQIRTPFGLEFRLRHDELPFMGVISGLHEVNGIKVFISKGIGCVFLPFRLFARPEVNLIEITA